jgi:hypothetical protein
MKNCSKMSGKMDAGSMKDGKKQMAAKIIKKKMASKKK